MQELLNFEQFFFVENLIKSKLEELEKLILLESVQW
jgi:hypothetical protein